MGLFDDFYGIMSMSNNYEERLVKNTKEDDWQVDTVLITDRSWQYETAVRSPHFREDNWIIVGNADTKEDAVKVHEQWIDMMRNHPKTYGIYMMRKYTYINDYRHQEC